MLKSLEATAIMVELNGLETVIGAVYQSPAKPLVEDNFGKLIELSKSRKFIFGGDFNCEHTDCISRLTKWKGRQIARYADRNDYAIFAPDSST